MRERMLTAHGETRSVAEWARLKGLTKTILTMRLDRGWSPERAVDTPQRAYKAHSRRTYACPDGVERTVREMADMASVSEAAMRMRLKNGWSVERALTEPPVTRDPLDIDGESLTFGAAVELAVAMPLSWLPLISDYTRDAEKPTQATWVSVLVYGAVSCWMYVIGMGAAIFTGEYDIAVIMVKAGLGIAALIILVFSTVTTTFLDAWSAGISAESLSAKLNGKKTAIAVTVIGTAAAILFPMDDITGFLYLIGSVFAPMIAVQIADHFILHRDRFAVAADARNLVIWLVGFIAYRLLMGVDTPVGYTLPDMVLTVVLCLLAEKAKPTKQM